MSLSRIKEIIEISASVKLQIAKDEAMLATVEAIVKDMVNAFKADKKVLFCGNGGSAADAQHLAAELSGRFYTDREPLFAKGFHLSSCFA